jgi:DNA/RNA endonuclease G (NUC1)
MRFTSLRAAVAALALAAISCSENDITGPGNKAADALTLRTNVVAAALPAVRISEIHYDNTGTDAGERIEVSLPIDADTTGYRIQLYNGGDRLPYGSVRGLATGTVTACTNGTRKVAVLEYGVNGIQNGNPDGIALIAPDGSLVEFLSYGGTFTSLGGLVPGIESTDIGVTEGSGTPLGHSLKRTGSGTWTGPSAHNFGLCNDDETPPQVVDSVAITPDGGTVIEGNTLQLSAAAFDAADQQIPGTAFTWTSRNEAAATVSSTGLVTGVAEGTAWIVAATTNGKADSVVVTVEDAPPVGTGETFISEIHYDNSGGDTNERIEVEGPAGVNLTGWSLVLYNGNGGVTYGTTINLTGVFPDLCSTRGVLTFLAPGLQNGSSTATGIDPDGIALVAPGNVVVDFISYEGTFTATNGPASGLTSTDIGVRQTGSRDDTQTLQRYENDWYGPSPGSPGACNGPPPPPSISFSGRTSGDPALPVGFQDQLFATLTDASGNQLDTAFVWSSDTPGTASIDQDGVITSLAAGSATFRATLKNSTITNTWTLQMTVAAASGLTYPGNTNFGIPTDSNPADDFIVTYPYFTSSFSSVRNIPNWVSYNIDAQYIAGPNDRCDCFTYDPGLPGTPYTTADYTGAGAFHGYGIDRGHLARSFDRTAGALDNAHTFYFSNIIPQTSDNNQGPWGAMEIYIGDFARYLNKEVYVIAGASGSTGTVKNEGLITIPEYVWKVAVIMDRDEGVADVQSAADIEVIAVVMPNIPGIRSVDWNTYRVTVDSVEKLSGYDVLSLLPDPIEIAVESETVAPVAAVDGPYSALEHESITMSGAASSDADGDDLTYAWSFGDGSTGTGVSVSHAYATGGTYAVQLIVTDIRGLADTVVTQAVIETPSQAAEDAIAIVRQLLAAGKLNKGNANSLIAKLQDAISSLAAGNENAALGQLRALLNQVDDFVSGGTLSPEDAAELRQLLVRMIASISQ